MGIGVFEFILLLVLIMTLGEVAIKVMAPLSSRLAELLGEMARDRRELRTGAGRGAGVEGGPTQEALEELEDRLARIEDRLDFIEELRAPEVRRRLDASSGAASSIAPVPEDR